MNPQQSPPQYAGPPRDVAPQDLWTKLTSTRRPFKDFTFKARGQDATVRIVVLTENELMHCRAQADAYAKQEVKRATGDRQSPTESSSLGYKDIYNNEVVVQIVCCACRDPNGQSVASMAFPNADLARQFFTSDELAVLFNAYCDWQSESGPIIASMTPEEMDAWLDKLQEGGSRVPLAALSSEAKNQLLLHSVSRLSTLRTGNGSAGSPQDVPFSSQS